MNEALSHELNTSVLRVNLFEWMEFEKGSTAILFNPAADIIVEALQKKGLIINTYEQGSSDRKERYDYVICIEDPLYPTDGLDDTDIEKMKELLKENGTMILAVSNRFGMKYLNGGISAEGQQPYDGIEMQTQVTKHELDEWMKQSGFSKVKYYYPVPDHVFPTQIFSDDFLPGIGDLRGDTANYWEGGIRVGKEDALGYQACDNELFSQLANSYLIIAER